MARSMFVTSVELAHNVGTEGLAKKKKKKKTWLNTGTILRFYFTVPSRLSSARFGSIQALFHHN